VRDITAVAVKILTEEPNRSQATQIDRADDLTGAAALTYSEVTSIFINVLDRPIHF